MSPTRLRAFTSPEQLTRVMYERRRNDIAFCRPTRVDAFLTSFYQSNDKHLGRTLQRVPQTGSFAPHKHSRAMTQSSRASRVSHSEAITCRLMASTTRPQCTQLVKVYEWMPPLIPADGTLVKVIYRGIHSLGLPNCFTLYPRQTCSYLADMFIPGRHVHTRQTCSYLADMFIPGRHVHTWQTCSYLADMFTPGRHVHTRQTCSYLADMFIPGRHVHTWQTCSHPADMFIPGRHVHTWQTCSYLVDMFIPGRHVHTWQTCSYLADMNNY